MTTATIGAKLMERSRNDRFTCPFTTSDPAMASHAPHTGATKDRDTGNHGVLPSLYSTSLSKSLLALY